MKWNILVGSLVLGFGLCTQSFGLDLLDRMLGTHYNGCCDKVTCCDKPCCVDPGPSCGCDNGCDACCVACKPKCRRTPLLNLLRSCKCTKSCCDCCDEPVCGCEDPGCGCEQPTCGCEATCCCKKCRRTPLLNLFRKLHSKKHCRVTNCCDCCDEPACGCEDPGCGCEDPGCGCEVKCCKKRCRVGLLDRIFGKRCCKKSCCEVTCGCEDPGCGCEDPGCGCEPVCGAEKGARANAPKEVEQKDEVGPAPVVDPSAFLPAQRRFIQTTFVR